MRVCTNRNSFGAVLNHSEDLVLVQKASEMGFVNTVRVTMEHRRRMTAQEGM